MCFSLQGILIIIQTLYSNFNSLNLLIGNIRVISNTKKRGMLYPWVRLIIVTVHMNLVELLKWQLNYSLLLNDISSYTVT